MDPSSRAVGSAVGEEQSVVDDLYHRLDELRALTRERLAAVRRVGPSGSPQNRSERDAFATLYEDRLAQLDAVEDRLCFGRLDFDDETVRYVGRTGLTDAEHTSILTDWRAPAAEAFYRATAARPEGVWRRRSIVTQGRRVTHLDDDVLDLERVPEDAAEVSGDGALLAALARGRTGRMGDIVATIQAEQDVIIRSELAGALVVQGGPGTGKTAVALHRAAYLLYAHRRRLEHAGVLVVGPSKEFLRYIDNVLPSLGETGVVNATMGTLYPGVTVVGEDSPEAARVKGSRLMATVVKRAVRARERVPAEPVRVRVDGHPLVVRPREVAEAIARARRTHRPHNEARATFVADMLARLTSQYVEALDAELAPEDRAAVTEDIRSDRDVRVALNLAWFPITPQRLVADLFTKPHRLAEAAPELSEAERAALAREQGDAWTAADVPLLDEAAELLGEDDQVGREELRRAAQQREEALRYARETLTASGAGGGLVDAETLAGRFESAPARATAAESAANDRTWTYGHVVVDEAQELSEMDWRALVRRCPTRSFTIVGDVAQTSSAAGTRDWDERLRPVLGPQLRHTRLTVNYRNPARVARAADEVARLAGLPVTTLESAREVPRSLVAVRQEAETAVPGAAVELALRELDGLAEGRVALIAAPRVLDTVRAVLERGRTTAGAPAPHVPVDPTGAPRVVALSPHEAKGLEFDVVVVVEPADISGGAGVADGQGGAADLYVAMTRPTRRLVLVGVGPWPAGAEPFLEDRA